MTNITTAEQCTRLADVANRLGISLKAAFNLRLFLEGGTDECPDLDPSPAVIGGAS
jgi:hypothetical protein